MSIYQDIILEHYRNPRNFGKLASPTHAVTVDNPLCGDRITLEVVVTGAFVKEVKFSGEGCAISKAASSMLLETVKNQPLASLIKLDTAYMIKLIGITVGPNRLKCLLLPLEALHKIVNING